MSMSLHRDASGWATRLSEEDIARYTQRGAWRNVTLADCASRQAEQAGQRIAVVEGERSASFGTLLAQANQLAAAFRAMGLQRGDVISFQLPNWIEAMVINLAACIAGLVVNPIVPIYRESEVRYILRDAGAIGELCLLESGGHLGAQSHHLALLIRRRFDETDGSVRHDGVGFADDLESADGAKEELAVKLIGGGLAHQSARAKLPVGTFQA